MAATHPRLHFPSKDTTIAAVALLAITAHLALRWTGPYRASFGGVNPTQFPLVFALVIGGLPLVAGLAARLVRRDFSSDLLAGISIVTAVILGEYLAGALVVLMLSGGQALEDYAVRSASSALEALVKRMPTRAHRRVDGTHQRRGPRRHHPATCWWCSPTRPAPSMASSSKAAAPWTSRT